MPTTTARALSWGDLADIQEKFDESFDPSRFGDLSAEELDQKEAEALADFIQQHEDGEPAPAIRYL